MSVRNTRSFVLHHGVKVFDATNTSNFSNVANVRFHFADGTEDEVTRVRQSIPGVVPERPDSPLKMHDKESSWTPLNGRGTSSPHFFDGCDSFDIEFWKMSISANEFKNGSMVDESMVDPSLWAYLGDPFGGLCPAMDGTAKKGLSRPGEKLRDELYPVRLNHDQHNNSSASAWSRKWNTQPEEAVNAKSQMFKIGKRGRILRVPLQRSNAMKMKERVSMGVSIAADARPAPTSSAPIQTLILPMHVPLSVLQNKTQLPKEAPVKSLEFDPQGSRQQEQPKLAWAAGNQVRDAVKYLIEGDHSGEQAHPAQLEFILKGCAQFEMGEEARRVLKYMEARHMRPTAEVLASLLAAGIVGRPPRHPPNSPLGSATGRSRITKPNRTHDPAGSGIGTFLPPSRLKLGNAEKKKMQIIQNRNRNHDRKFGW
jgi:hypothetical protein